MKNPWDEIAAPSHEVTARRIDHKHPLDLFWARDQLGHYLFIFELPATSGPDTIKFPDLVGIRTQYGRLATEPDKKRLILLLNEQSNWEIFLALCTDLFESSALAKSPGAAILAILGRLERWQQFLRRTRSGILSEDEIVGLIGELLFIKRHLAPVFRYGQSIKFWQGPEGSPQDFNVNDCAIEVKSHGGSSPSAVRISSVEQLCSRLPVLYLHVVTMGKASLETANSINLRQLVSEIREASAAEPTPQVERFDDLLHGIGYIDSDRYLEFNYLLLAEHTFEVVSGFPRICPDRVPAGVVGLSYSVNLAECAAFAAQPDWMRGRS